MPSTFVHALLPTSCVFSSKRALPKLTRNEWIKLAFCAVFIANSPDLDIIPASLFPEIWKSIHREWGHNIFALTLWIILGKKLLCKWVSNKFTAKTAYYTSVMLVLSHILLDGMHDYSEAGELPTVPLLFPISNWQWRLPIYLFKVVPLQKDIHFLLAFVTSERFWSTIIFYEFLHMGILWLLYSVVFNLIYFAKKLIATKKNLQIKENEDISQDIRIRTAYQRKT